MKKMLFILLSISFLLLAMPNALAKEKAKVYVFSGAACPHCQTAYEYFEGLLENEPGLFDLYALEVYDEEWNVTDTKLEDLFMESLKYYDLFTTKEKMGTPFIVIGDNYLEGVGNIRAAYDYIIEVNNSEEPVTYRVEEVNKELNVNLEQYKKDYGQEEEEKKEKSKSDIFILIGLLVVLIGGFTGFVIMGQKK